MNKKECESMTENTVLSGEDTALVVAEAEAESDEQAEATAKAATMTDAERAEAYKRVRPIAVKADRDLNTAIGKVENASLIFGRSLWLIQAYKLWKAPKVTDEKGRKVSFSSYGKWFDAQEFNASRSRGAQCVTLAIKEYDAIADERQAEWLAATVADGMDITNLVSFVAKRQKGSPGRPITLASRAAQVFAAIDAFNQKMVELSRDADGNILDEDFAELVQGFSIELTAEDRADLQGYVDETAEGTIEDAQSA